MSLTHASAMDDKEVSMNVKKLNGENYSSWSGYMRAVFLSKGVWNVVNIGNTPTFTHVQEKLEFDKRNGIALGLLLLHMKAEFHHLIQEFDMSWMAWKKLQDLFKGQQKAGRIYLKRQLFSLEMKESDNVLQHCNKVLGLQAELTSIGAAMADEDLSVCLLHSLPKSYEHIVTYMEMNDRELHTQDIIRALTNEHVKRTASETNVIKDETSAFNTEREVRKCTYCGRDGHLENKCWSKYGRPKRFTKRADYTIQNDDNEFIAFATSLDNKSEGSSKYLWAIDSGATHHICRNKEQFSELTKTHGDQVIVANGNKVNILGEGTVEEKVILPCGYSRTLKIMNVLYIPDMGKNLLSIPQINRKNNFKTIFLGNLMEVCDKRSDKLVAIGDWYDGLYWLRVEPRNEKTANTSTHSNDGLKIWHERLGHVNNKVIKWTLQQQYIENMNWKESSFSMCSGCKMGKMVEKPFKANMSRDKHKLFELLHWDICGPMENKSIGGSIYLLLIVDDYSMCLKGYYLKQRSESEQCIIEYITKIERQFHIQVKKV